MKKVTTQQQQKPQPKKVVKKAQSKANKVITKKGKETAPKKASKATPIVSKFNVTTTDNGIANSVEIEFGGYIINLIEGIVQTAKEQPRIEYFLQRLCEEWMIHRIESYVNKTTNKKNNKATKRTNNKK
jgi:hypothetical protein